MEHCLLPLAVLLTVSPLGCLFLEPTIDETCLDQPKSISLDWRNEMNLPILELRETTVQTHYQILQPRAPSERQPLDKPSFFRRIKGLFQLLGHKPRKASSETSRSFIAQSKAQKTPVNTVVVHSSFKVLKSQAQSSPMDKMVKELAESHTPIAEYKLRHLKSINNQQVSSGSSRVISGAKTAKRPIIELSSPTDLRAVVKKLQIEKEKRDMRRQERRDKGLKSETPTPPTPPEEQGEEQDV